MKTAMCIGFLLFSFWAIPAQEREPASWDMVLFDQWGHLNCEEYLAHMDNIINHLKEPDKTVYFLVYEGRTHEYKGDGTQGMRLRLPQYGLARTKIRSMKKYLRSRGADIKKVEFISGGFREEFMIDVYLVPRTSTVLPTANPTLEKMKYRRGKPVGYCMGCCD